MSVTSARGFRAAGIAAGLKSTGAEDIALVVNDGPEYAAGAVVTKNRVKAAPVVFSAHALETAHALDAPITAVLLNSGGANACTGEGGYADTTRSAAHVASLLAGHTTATQVLVCSTGLIGVRLPMPALLAGAEGAHAQLDAGELAGAAAARAIMTTDTVPKTATHTEHGVTVGGMAKGAGMLAPQLATMLVVVTTDAQLTHAETQRIIAEASRTTFNRVDSDACMSTNDTVILLASGASGVRLSEADMTERVRAVCADLARQLVADAEGASHDVLVRVENATSEEAAEAVAREIARSNLVKAAIFGNDPNWGRIAAAAGCVSEAVAPFDPHRMNISVNGVWVCRAGGVGEDREKVDMTEREVRIVMELNAGDASAEVWTNDLTHEYVEENSAYSS
ncbi:MAG: bifunctional glutamate N-acetyltransferase/amino-acid acetyltransferase ArgJ [Dermabacter sp.]|nr:bifunctional glutamate N-acetyltransferase/amino-acid acetyltransferase ArgJ [Dermabacter sp.]